jgi:antirestriction protein ArdC
LADSIGYYARFEELNGPAGYCDPVAKHIVLDHGLTKNGQVKTFIHELAHALVREDRQDGDPDLTYAQEELVVESIAMSTCGVLGLDTSGYSIAYLASWSTNTELEVLERTAALINRLANRIEDAIVTEAVAS